MKTWILTVIINIVIFSQILAQKQTITLQSKHISKSVNVLLITPQDNNTTKKYPTVILLHGYGGNYKSWDTMVNLQAQANALGFIFVCPDGMYNSWYIDSPLVDDSNYYSFLVSDLLPTVQQIAKVDSSQLFIDGYSMGGHGALYLFLKKSEHFVAVGSISGVLDLQYSSFKATSLTYLLGPYSEQTWSAYTAIEQLSHTQTKKPLIVSCGAEDRLIECNRIFVKQARKLGFNITYIEAPGKHDSVYWKDAFYLHLQIFEHLCTR